MDVTGEPVLEARALWILAQIGGREVVEKFLENEDDEKLQVVAYRALRHRDPLGTLALAQKYAVERIYFCKGRSLSLRGVPFQDCRSFSKTD